MSEPVLVAVAWPYANAEIHVGNLTGAYLPADIFARFQRLMGRQGVDGLRVGLARHADHGAGGRREQHPAGSLPAFHAGFIDLFQQLGCTTTCSPARTPKITLKSRRRFSWRSKRMASCIRRPNCSGLHLSGTLLARSLCGRHLLHLRLYQCAQRPVRPVRQPARPGQTDRTRARASIIQPPSCARPSILSRPGQAAAGGV
jgi:hypothetical protein